LLLFTDKLRVDALGEVLQEGLVIADLHDLACFHYDDLVGILDGRESVSNHDSGDVTTEFFTDFINGGLNLSLVSFVKGTSSLI